MLAFFGAVREVGRCSVWAARESQFGVTAPDSPPPPTRKQRIVYYLYIAAASQALSLSLFLRPRCRWQRYVTDDVIDVGRAAAGATNPPGGGQQQLWRKTRRRFLARGCCWMGREMPRAIFASRVVPSFPSILLVARAGRGEVRLLLHSRDVLLLPPPPHALPNPLCNRAFVDDNNNRDTL